MCTAVEALGASHPRDIYAAVCSILSGQNGYYKWEPTEKAYIKSAQAPAGAWRVPNVYDLVSAVT